METEALKQLQLFKDSNDAFEKRGYANFATMMREVIENLYDISKVGKEVKQEAPIDDMNPLSRTDDGHGNRKARSDYAY